MAGSTSKRQQARNEKILQELIRSVSGNNFCADCQARNPTWASWSLGIFLCMRCAAIHRKLGTHISKVKSLSMDSWSNEQVENMKKVGNTVSNRNYNPNNKLSPISLDMDEADSVVEKFIRQKYIGNSPRMTTRHNSGSTDSDETPPPLPPKTPSRFGLFFSKSKKANHNAQQLPIPSERDQPSPRRRMSCSYSSYFENTEDPEEKLAWLRNMGFGDGQRNALVLKGVNGNLDRAIEALVRLGEGGRATVARSATTASVQPTQTPQPSTLATSYTATSSQITMPVPANLPSTNPFDKLDLPPVPSPAQPLSTQSTGTLANKNPFMQTNPFGMSCQQNSSSLNHGLQSISPAFSQPLFPHHTGGVTTSQSHNLQVAYQQPATPPVPQMPFHSNMAFGINQTSARPAQQVQNANHNPFFMNQQQALTPQQPLPLNTAGDYGNNFANNPFVPSPTRVLSPTLTRIPEQSQYISVAVPVQSQSNNPFFSHPSANAMPHETRQMPQYASQTQQMAYPPRPDKASILALYNYPHLAPSSLQAQQEQQQQVQNQPRNQPQPPAAPGPGPLFPAQTNPLQGKLPAPAAKSSPLPDSKNPFMVGRGLFHAETMFVPQPQPQLVDLIPKSARSRESVIALGMEWLNGRHSPDAFASLSARDTR